MRFLVALVVLLLLTGCQSLMRNASSNLAAQLGAAVENHDDPETVAAGLPAYLLMLDALIEGDPEGVPLLLGAARLYSAYAGSFVDDTPRAQRLSTRAQGYAERALCPRQPTLCHSHGFAEFEQVLAQVPARDGELLLVWGMARAGWIQAHSHEWDAIADIPRVQAALERVQVLRPALDKGQPELYLGVLNTLLPEAYGGRPEAARALFEQALELSGGRNQMARVLLAERYARLVFDRELHDTLLRDALQPRDNEDGFRLVNRLAQQRAQQLLDSSDEYFGDFHPDQDFDEDSPVW